jgi:endoglucanase
VLPTGRGADLHGNFQFYHSFIISGCLNPGWDLGNTLDAVQNEGDWNNPPVVAATFDDVKAAESKGSRLPGEPI